MSYLIGGFQSQVAIPVFVRHQLTFSTVGTGKLDISIGPKQTMGRNIEDAKIEVPMPKTVLNCTLTSTQGKYAFDPVSKILSWEVGKIDGQKLPNIRGSITLQSGAVVDSNPTISV